MPDSTLPSPAAGDAVEDPVRDPVGDPVGDSAALRSFFWGLETERAPAAGSWTPPVLAPYLDRETRSPDPFVFAPGGRVSEGGPRSRCALLPDLVDDLVDADAPTVLHENRLRLERSIRGSAPRTPLIEAFEAAGDRLRKDLELPEAEAARLAEGLERLLGRLRGEWGPGAVLLPIDAATPLTVLSHVLRERRARALVNLRAESLQLREGLRALLDAHSAAASGDSGLGALGGRWLDGGALSTLPRTRRSALDAERTKRIEAALGELERFESLSPDAVFVDPEGGDADVGDDRRIHSATDPIAGAREAYDEESGVLLVALRALRTARLELAGAFDPERHGPWLAALDRRALEPVERAALPAVVLVLDEPSWNRDLARVADLLRSGRPIVVVVRRDPFPVSHEGPRLEPASLGLGMREIVVLQASTGIPEHLVRGARRVASTSRPSLVVISRPNARDGVPAWLAEAAAVDARAHPLFLYDPDAGTTWARRFELGPVPDPASDWVRQPAPEGSGAETVAFTVGDLALLAAGSETRFRAVPEDVEGDDLLALDVWLDLDAEDAGLKLPFVPGRNAEGEVRRLVVDHELAAAVRDQLDHWRSLRELAGIRNEHVERAVARAREEDHRTLEERLEELEARHEQELKAVRDQAADEAVERVLGALLSETRHEGILGTPPPPTTSAPAGDESRQAEPAEPGPDAEAASEKPEAPAAVPAASTAPEEPWIDSELCTSCGDCLARNGQLFAYDENKRAFIKDPKGGSYAEIVQAAEACPARVIHPGTPLDPDESDLETWVARAEPFR